MALVVIPALSAAALVSTTPSPLDRTRSLDPSGQLGFGIVRPFRRDQKNDFANAGGAELVRACVGQILGMRGANQVVKGELDWDPERGSLLHLLRQKGSDTVLQNLGRAYVVDVLRKYEPRVQVKSVRITREPGPEGPDNILLIRLVYDILAAPAPSNLVLYPGVDQSITFAQAA